MWLCEQNQVAFVDQPSSERQDVLGAVMNEEHGLWSVCENSISKLSPTGRLNFAESCPSPI
jgi:hypothetical protein